MVDRAFSRQFEIATAELRVGFEATYLAARWALSGFVALVSVDRVRLCGSSVLWRHSRGCLPVGEHFNST
mgnify:CR=1